MSTAWVAFLNTGAALASSRSSPLNDLILDSIDWVSAQVVVCWKGMVGYLVWSPLVLTLVTGFLLLYNYTSINCGKVHWSDHLVFYESLF